MHFCYVINIFKNKNTFLSCKTLSILKETCVAVMKENFYAVKEEQKKEGTKAGVRFSRLRLCGIPARTYDSYDCSLVSFTFTIIKCNTLMRTNERFSFYFTYTCITLDDSSIIVGETKCTQFTYKLNNRT